MRVRLNFYNKLTKNRIAESGFKKTEQLNMAFGLGDRRQFSELLTRPVLAPIIRSKGNWVQLILVLLCLFIGFPTTGFADELDTTFEVPAVRRLLVAQSDEGGGGDDTYDPFADYSDFDGTAEEEADINFFKNGRFFTLAFTFGYRRFTENLAQIYSPGTFFGGYITYFFDLRFALQVGFVTGDHPLSLDYSTTTLRGTTTVSSTSFHLKYYFNTQNVTKGLANLNPYLVGGFSQIYRTTRVSGYDTYARDNAVSFDLGGGIEIPLLNNKMFLGLQALYQLTKFSDENVEYTWKDNADNTYRTGFYPRGDLVQASLLLGVNF